MFSRYLYCIQTKSYETLKQCAEHGSKTTEFN